MNQAANGRDEVGDDEDPAGLPAPHLDEAGELEHAERLPQGRLGDAELLGHLRLGQALGLPQPAHLVAQHGLAIHFRLLRCPAENRRIHTIFTK